MRSTQQGCLETSQVPLEATVPSQSLVAAHLEAWAPPSLALPVHKLLDPPGAHDLDLCPYFAAV